MQSRTLLITHQIGFPGPRIRICSLRVCRQLGGFLCLHCVTYFTYFLFIYCLDLLIIRFSLNGPSLCSYGIQCSLEILGALDSQSSASCDGRQAEVQSPLCTVVFFQ